MIYPEDKNSSIDLAIRSLERAHQLKKEEFKSRKVYQNFFSGSSFLSQPENSLSMPVSQIQNVIKESEEVLRFFSEKMQQEIKQNPWTFLGKVALGSFGFGLIAARRLTSRTKVEK